jgi:glycine C-acetyltransferase/8-amino-7-oxononanoate synthase
MDLQERLDELKGLGLHRRMRLVSGPQGPRVVLDGKPVLVLCSSNYLGLADHPRVREAAAEAAMRWGVGAGSSRSAAGTMTVHGRRCCSARATWRTSGSSPRWRSPAGWCWPTSAATRR